MLQCSISRPHLLRSHALGGVVLQHMRQRSSSAATAAQNDPISAAAEAADAAAASSKTRPKSDLGVQLPQNFHLRGRCI